MSSSALASMAHIRTVQTCKGENLEKCIFLNQSQVNSAKGDNLTKLPFMIDRPSHW